MSDCCDPVPYRRFFNHKEASRRLKRYRRRGLDKMATRIVAYVTERGVSGHTILEVGGGVGDLQVELLKAGAVHATNIELSGGYEDAAAELIEAEGLGDRMERRLGDFVEEKDLVDPADIVVLNRVICCYPWMERMMEASVAKTSSLLAIVVPRDRWTARVFVRLSNAVIRLTGCAFESFVHPVAEMEAITARSGMKRVYSATDLMWHGMVFERV